MAKIDTGVTLAERHREQRQLLAKTAPSTGPADEVDPSLSLLNYAERAQTDDWSLRSALVRLAQPHPQLVSELLTISRRLDAVLQPARTKLLKHVGPAQHPPAAVDPVASRDQDLASGLYLDTRLADLGRRAAGLPASELAEAAHQLLTGYQTVPQDPEISDLERQALPLLAVAAGFEAVSAVLTAWAADGHENPPIDAVSGFLPWGGAALDALAVPDDAGSMATGRPRRPRRT